MLARAVPSKNLRFIAKATDGSRTIEIGGADAVNHAIAESLGVLPDHTIKMFILVEGVIDIAFLKSVARAFRSHGANVPDLDSLELNGEIVFVPAGGAANLAYWASRLKELRRPEFHLFDRDAPTTAPPKHQAKIEAVNQRQDCKAVTTSRLEIENFVHHRAIITCAQAQQLVCNLSTPFGADDDVPKLLAAELNQHAPAHSKWNQTRVKGWLAETVVPTMTAEMIAEVDPANEMMGWMVDIATMLAPQAVTATG